MIQSVAVVIRCILFTLSQRCCSSEGLNPRCRIVILKQFCSGRTT